MADIEGFDDLPEDFELTEADMAYLDPDDPFYEDPFKDDLPLELQNEVKELKNEGLPENLGLKDSAGIDAVEENTPAKTSADTAPFLKEPVEQFEEFDVDYGLEDDPFPELDEEEVKPLANESKVEDITTNSKLDRRPGEVEDGELDMSPVKTSNRSVETKPIIAQESSAHRTRGMNQRRIPTNGEGFQSGIRYMPYRPMNGNPRANGMMLGLRPFPSGNIHVNPNFRGFQQRPPFPMNPVAPFGIPMMGMQPWMMNGRGYTGVRPGFAREFNQSKSSDMNDSIPRKNPPLHKSREQRLERQQQRQEDKRNGSPISNSMNGKRCYTTNSRESHEERKKHHPRSDLKQQDNPKADSSLQPEMQTNAKGIRVVVSNVSKSVSRPQLIEMADSIKKGSIQSVVIDRRNSQAEMIFQTTDSAKMFRRKFHRSALGDNHITVNIS